MQAARWRSREVGANALPSMIIAPHEAPYHCVRDLGRGCGQRDVLGLASWRQFASRAGPHGGGGCGRGPARRPDPAVRRGARARRGWPGRGGAGAFVRALSPARRGGATAGRGPHGPGPDCGRWQTGPKLCGGRPGRWRIGAAICACARGATRCPRRAGASHTRAAGPAGGSHRQPALGRSPASRCRFLLRHPIRTHAEALASYAGRFTASI